jgi:hypothetical protein
MNYLQGELQQMSSFSVIVITMISSVQLRSDGSPIWSTTTTTTAAAAARMSPSSCIAPTVDLDCTMTMIRVSVPDDDGNDDKVDILTKNVLADWLRLLFRPSSLLPELSADGVTADLAVYVDDTSSQQSMMMMTTMMMHQKHQKHRLLPVMRYVLASVVRECGWSSPVVAVTTSTTTTTTAITTTTTTNPQPPAAAAVTNSYAETAMIQLTALRAFARCRADCGVVSHNSKGRRGGGGGGGGGALDGSVVANLFFSPSSSQAMLLSSLLSDEAAPPLVDDHDDVLSQLVRGQVALWLHNIELADEVIFQRSMKLFRTHKSIMQV